MTDYVEKQILVVVKTYPNPSSRYGETVCCAGVDVETRQWVRLYPITFRLLADRRFKKFQLIRCRVARRSGDNRPESWRVDQDTIELLGGPMPTGRRGWAARMAAMPPASRSLDEIQEAQSSAGTSLGMFRPREIVRFNKRPAEPWDERQSTYLRQQHLDLGTATSRQLNELEQIPWRFGYQFTCYDERCKGHDLSIIDWELGAAYRTWQRDYGTDWEAKLREKFEQELPASDLHLVVGNLAAHRGTFVIIGLVRPPRIEVNRGYVQQSLDLMRQERSVAGIGLSLEAKQADTLAAKQHHEALEFFPEEG